MYATNSSDFVPKFTKLCREEWINVLMLLRTSFISIQRALILLPHLKPY